MNHRAELNLWARLEKLEQLVERLCCLSRSGYTGLLDGDLERLLGELRELREQGPANRSGDDLPLPFGRLRGD
jgi:hypothetical protein